MPVEATEKLNLSLTTKTRIIPLIKSLLLTLTSSLVIIFLLDLYTLVLHPNHTYEYLLNLEVVSSGKIADDWGFLPTQTIPDKDAVKPDDWVDEPFIDDPTDIKPEDSHTVDEYIPDPSAVKPQDWDDEMDGVWEPPKILNPEFKGNWQPKRIANPNFIGYWEPPQLQNPEYKEIHEELWYKSAFLGFDLWQVRAGTIFDNIIVTDSLDEAKDFAKGTYIADREKEVKAKRELEDRERKAEDERIAKLRQAEKSDQTTSNEHAKDVSESEQEHMEL
jgi:calreticulin